MTSQLPKISYMFGAGASAQALPTIKQLPERIKFVRDYLENNYVFDDAEIYSPKNGIEINRNTAKAFLVNGLEELYNVSVKHSTIDTYAKRLYINGKSGKVNELCFFLSLYFNLEQKIVGVDSRYDTFLISILDSSAYKFPNNLKFLTWNYDSQMEIAHSRITGHNENDADNNLFNSDLSRAVKDEFASIKINGNCNITGRFRDTFPLVQNILKTECAKDDLNFVMSFGHLQLLGKQRIYDASLNLNFAWYQNSERLKQISNLCEDTEILVVIGYSFPFFNRDIDRKIIQSMSNLKKIYIQDCYPENIKSRFLSILPNWEENGIQIILVSDVTDFFLPPEL